jgi:hypothetical protein
MRGATKECKQAIRPVKNGDLSTWVSPTQDIVTQTYMATSLVVALTNGSPTVSHITCFGCGQKGHWKGTDLRAKVTRAPCMSHQEENLLKCAHDAIKALIGLKIVNPNIILMGETELWATFSPQQRRNNFLYPVGKFPEFRI